MELKLKHYLIRSTIAAICSGVLLFVVIFALTSGSLNPSLSYSGTGQIGDTIGGISAPFIGVSGAILTFLAFFIQYKANETHNRQFDEQSSEQNSRIKYYI